MSSRDGNILDTVIYYAGIGISILGIAMAGASVIKAMLLK